MSTLPCEQCWRDTPYKTLHNGLCPSCASFEMGAPVWVVRVIFAMVAAIVAWGLLGMPGVRS